MQRERRRFTRVPYNVVARLKSGDELIDCEVRDLAFRGLYARSASDIPEGSEVVVVIHLTNEEARPPLRIKGKIVRKSEKGFGVEFAEMDLDTFTDLKHILVYQSGSETLLMEELMDFIEET